MSSKVMVIISTAEKAKALTGIMYFCFRIPHSNFRIPRCMKFFLNPAPLYTSPKIIGRKNRLPVLDL